jgi:hypothetical protein
VNTVMNFWFHKAENFLTNTNFSKTILCTYKVMDSVITANMWEACVYCSVAAYTLIPCHGDVLRCLSHASTFSVFVYFVR